MFNSPRYRVCTIFSVKLRHVTEHQPYGRSGARRAEVQVEVEAETAVQARTAAGVGGGRGHRGGHPELQGEAEVVGRSWSLSGGSGPRALAGGGIGGHGRRGGIRVDGGGGGGGGLALVRGEDRGDQERLNEGQWVSIRIYM
jgi:hypothetical protein